MSGDTQRLQRARHLMMAALDGELDSAERAELERLLVERPELRAELDRMGKVKEVTRAVTYRKPPEEVWDRYFESVYNRLERGIGWLLVFASASVLALWALWHAVEALFEDSSMPFAIKLSIFALLAGGTILLLSVFREKWFTRKADPYREIQR